MKPDLDIQVHDDGERYILALKEQPLANDPFKINLQNYLRDFIIGVDIS